tara:strand:- start:1380 stop:4253 length:2874 start_codon:yes stop_codon:yes gene_type:complete
MGNPKNSKHIKKLKDKVSDASTELTGVDISDAKSSVKSKVYFDSLSKIQKNKLARHGRVTIDGITYSSTEIRENGVTPVYQDKIMRSVKDIVEPEASFKDKFIGVANKYFLGPKTQIKTGTGTVTKTDKSSETVNQQDNKKVETKVIEALAEQTETNYREASGQNTNPEPEVEADETSPYSSYTETNYREATAPKKEPAPKQEYKEFFERNILHDYDTVTYHFKLSMLSEQDTIKAQDHIIRGNFEDETQWKDWKADDPMMVIAETGGTVLSINGVQIEATAGPINNGKRLTGAVDFNITIQQPLKASFTDTIVNAAIALGLPDGLKATYLLELWFIGRDPDTGAIVNPIDHSMRQFLISIVEVQANVDTMGATYQLRAARAGDFGIRQHTYTTDRPMQLSGITTVNSMIKKLSDALNLNELDKLAIEKGILDEYYIKLDPNAEEKLGQDTLLITGSDGRPITNLTKEGTDQEGNKTDTQQKEFSIPEGTSIDRILEFGITHSKKLQKMSKGLKKGADPDSSDAKDVDNFVKMIYKIKVDVKNIKWDVLRNDYAREYQYTISLYPTIRPEILPGTWKDQPAVAQEKIKALISLDISRGESKPYRALSKRYDYLFTGLNDKVLRFDIKYNNQFFLALHSYRNLYDGIGKDKQEIITRASDVLIDFKSQQQKVRTAWESYLQAKSDNFLKKGDELDSILSPKFDKFKEERKELIKLYIQGVDDKVFEGTSIGDTEYNGEELTLEQKTESAIAALEGNKQQVQTNTQNVVWSSDVNVDKQVKDMYAELIDSQQATDMVEASGNAFKLMWGAVPDQFRSTINSDGQTPGRGHLNSVIEASLSDFEADLVAMDMDIKGDPFWLESERNSRYKEQADLYEGENYLLFTAITSAGEPDPETGVANPRTQEFGREQLLNGVYAVVSISSRFEGGQFVQNIKGVKDAFITDISILEQLKERKPEVK